MASKGSAATRVLIVDDQREIRFTTTIVLEKAGFDVRSAADGVEAIQAYHEFRPAIVLLDIGIPKLDGHQVTRRIRREPGGESVLIIMASAYGSDSDKLESEQAGANFHLVKPLDWRGLLPLLMQRQ